MKKIRNVAIFMSDSVRWELLPEEIRKRGISLKTIASSSHTPTSLASMLTGLWLPQHGVRGFTETLPEEVETILDRFPNRGLSDVGGDLHDHMLGEFFNETIYDYLFDRYPRAPLTEMEEPFAWFMRDPGGHAPYGKWDENMNAEMSVPDFYQKYGGKTKTLRELHREGLDSSVERFKKYVLGPLEDRGILEDTLVIFLSDHGELLGEYGHVSQSYPICPELVYVPTVYIHPELESPKTELTRHVDMPDTIAHLTGKQRMTSTAGTSIFDDGYSHETGYCLYDRMFPSFRGQFSYEIDSMWDNEGGHVFVRSNNWNSTKLTLGYLTKISAGAHLRRTHNLEGFKLLYANQKTWGSPDFSVETAETKLQQIKEQSVESATRTMDIDTEKRLEDLGYL